MAGLLDFLNTPQGIGLLSGVAGYAAGARRGTPVNNIGRGLVTGLSGYASAQDQLKQESDNALAKQFKQMQMEQMAQTIADAKARREAAAGAMQDVNKPTQYAVGGQSFSDPQQAQTSAANMFSLPSDAVPSFGSQSPQAPQPLAFNQPANVSPPMAFMPSDAVTQPAQTGLTDFSGGQAASIAEQKSPDVRTAMYNRLMKAGQIEAALKFAPEKPKLITVGNSLVEAAPGVPAKAVYTAPDKPLTPSGDFATFTLLKQQGQLPENTDYTTWHRGNSKAGAAVTNAITNVNAYEPFKNKIQGEMGSALVKSYETLQSVPQTLQALDSAKAYAAQAHNFSGSMGEDKLAIAKFFNNNLGTNIDPEGVKSAEALKSALFYNVMDNLKKMDASPSQQQQQRMAEAFGNIGTDPNALPWIIDFYKKQITSKAIEHNRRVDQTMSGPAGVQFPYDIHVHVPDTNTAKTKPAQAFTLPPNASKYNGKTMRDTQTGKRYMSVGGKWQEVK